MYMARAIGSRNPRHGTNHEDQTPDGKTRRKRQTDDLGLGITCGISIYVARCRISCRPVSFTSFQFHLTHLDRLVVLEHLLTFGDAKSVMKANQPWQRRPMTLRQAVLKRVRIRLKNQSKANSQSLTMRPPCRLPLLHSCRL